MSPASQKIKFHEKNPWFTYTKNGNRFSVYDEFYDRDLILICFFVKQFQKNSNSANRLSISMVDIAQAMYPHRENNKQDVENIVDSIKRFKQSLVWAELNGGQAEKFFSILDCVLFGENFSTVTIKINDCYMQAVTKQTGYFDNVNFNEYRKIEGFVSLLLYQVLINMQAAESKIWSFAYTDFITQMNIAHQTEQEFLITIDNAVQEINKKATMRVFFNFDAQNSMCIFKVN